ncbi:unnamed protein product [Onchocerca ochengi]|nr:unnamed protein product [Onchocerca ochengi]
MAHATLTELLSSVSLSEIATSATTYPADKIDPDVHSDDDNDLLYLYDRIISSEQSPVFVAADLNILPLQLIIDKDDSKSELLREIRQLKRFIQDALNGRVDEPPINQADSSVQTINEGQSQPDGDLHGQQSASSSSSSSVYCLASSPKLSFKSSTNASTSSPELPASTSSISSTSCLSLLSTTMASPVPPYHPENNQNIIGASNSTIGGTLALNNMTLSNGNNNNNNRDDTSTSTNSITTSISSNNNNHNRRKRDGCGNRLDAMVQKLANRQKEKEAAAAAGLVIGSTGSTIGSSGSSSFSSIASSSSSSSCTTTTTATITSLMVPSEQNLSPAKAIWHTQMIDPVAYVSMLRTMSGAAAAAAAATAISSPSSIFPSINKTIQNDRW